MLILIVDDMADVRSLLQSVLEMQGFETERADSGEAALALLDKGLHPAAIVLDIQMPDMDGWETLENIRRNPKTCVIPVVLCTVRSSPKDMLRGWELGCDGYVAKPFDLEGLVGTLLKLTGRPPAEREVVRASEIAYLREQTVGRA